MLDALKAKTVDPPKPFPIHKQYVKSIERSRQAPDSDEVDADGEGPDRTAEPEAPPKRTWDYKDQKAQFVKEQREDGVSQSRALELWDDSMEKAKILGGCSVQELKRRKFLPKGATTNPWQKNVEGK